MVLPNVGIVSAAASATNPLLPTWWEVLVPVLALLAVVAAVAALVSLARWAKNLSGGAVVAWALFIAFLPLLGSALWFVARFRQGRPASAT